MSSALTFSLIVFEELSSGQCTQQHLQAYQGFDVDIILDSEKQRLQGRSQGYVLGAFQAILMYTQVQCHCSTPTVVLLPFISSVEEDVSQGKIRHRMDGMRAFSRRSTIASGILKRSKSIREPEMWNHFFSLSSSQMNVICSPDGKQ